MAARRPRTTSPSTTGPAMTSPATTAEDTPTSGRTFDQLGVPAALVDVLSARGITTPFPIQTATLPDSLSGRDVLGRGRTGSGKTYAFALPLLARLAASTRPRRPGKPRALVLAPTRELADQIAATVAPLAEALGLTATTIYGGVRPGPQVAALRAGVDVLIACPGRLADHIATGRAHLDAVEVTVLDEADHMADLGFLPVVTKLLDKTPRGTQRLLFSATLDAGVDVLIRRFLSNPATHSTDPPSAPVTAMTHHVLHVQPAARLPVLVDLVAAPGRAVVFTRTKRGATKLTRQLVAEGVPAVELHGDLGQTARTRNLLAFTDGRVSTLVATDIAARGIHVDDVALVIHADPPVEHKAYLHRSGRTARAGASGTVITLMTDAQVADVRDLTRKAGVTATTTRLRPGHPLLAELAPGERTFVAPTAATQPARAPRAARKPAGAKRQQPSTPKRTRSAVPAAAAPVAVKTTSVAAFSAGSRAGRRGGR
ncbi:Superfamily II DNA and RNA helicase [Actinokineospora globicatena]|nr:Superfamily II DNA and RNA helicase [Actinokineospora globicatena]GLW79766.1 RNA helicase [Actinokineospora globicatena]GLW85824.1 RNA helicase [Actinokineospora globicatena]